MYLIDPRFVSEGAVLPTWKIPSYGELLCEDFAQGLHIRAPRVICIDDVLENDSRHGMLTCQSPVGMFAHSTLTGDIAIVPVALSHLLLQFVIAHTLVHRVIASMEWVYDLMALDLLNCPLVPINESAARVIAQTRTWRARALQFQSGHRVVAIGDALTSHVWEDSLVQIPHEQVRRCPITYSTYYD
jgi:hypothetical protein